MRIDEIRIIRGELSSKFPFCTSIFVDDSVRVIIDPGAGYSQLKLLNENYKIDYVINTHVHIDHISFNYIFKDSKILITHKESECFKDRSNIPEHMGVSSVYGEEWVTNWISKISKQNRLKNPNTPQNQHQWWVSTNRMDGTFDWGELMDFGKTRIKVLAAPGHSKGSCCLYFPRQGAIYTADIDLTKFGPWYFGKYGSIDDFISSASSLSHLDADYFITGHEEGIFNKKEFCMRLSDFLEIIEKRDCKILSYLEIPRSIEELTEFRIIYAQTKKDDWIRAFEKNALEKHVSRLLQKGLILSRCGKYIRR